MNRGSGPVPPGLPIPRTGDIPTILPPSRHPQNACSESSPWPIEAVPTFAVTSLTVYSSMRLVLVRGSLTRLLAPLRHALNLCRLTLQPNIARGEQVSLRARQLKKLPTNLRSTVYIPPHTTHRRKG